MSHQATSKFLPALALAAGLGVAPAQAAIYTGIWDPAYGAPFPDLGWKGKATFFVPDACLALTGWVSNNNACSGGGMDVLDASLSFYDLSTDPTGTGTPAETFTLDPGVTVYQMFVDGGALKGVSTDFFLPVAPSTPAAQSIAGGGSTFFHLRFVKQVSPDGTPSVQLVHTDGYQDPICVFEGSCDGGVGQVKAVLELTLVPEPQTYALMLAGLAAVGFAARRRRPAR